MLENIDSDFTTSDDVKITKESKEFLLTAAKWANFLSITGFIGIGLVAVLYLVMTGKFGGFGIQSLFSLAMIGVYIFPTLYMFRFAKNIREGLNTTQQYRIEEGFENLNAMFKFLGIFTIIILSLYLLIFLIALVGLSAGRML